MTEAIMTALISGGLALIGVLVTNHFGNQKMAEATDRKLEVFQATVTEKIEQLRQAQEKHNSVIERTYKLESNDALQDAELHRINKRIEALEGKK